MPKVAIFYEYGIGYGMGHHTRCKILQKYLLQMGVETVLCPYNKADDKKKSWFYQENILTYLNNIDFVIIDSYQANYKIYQLALEKVKCVLVIDDIARIIFPKECIIFNGGIDTAGLYQDDYYKVFAGIEYMICDNKFFQTKKDLQTNTLLICFGGSDISNFSQKVYDRLKETSYRPIVVLGDYYQADFKGKCEVYRSVDENAMKDIFQRIDFAVTAGGRMLNELLMSEVPSLVIPTAQNQYHQVRAYAEKKVVLKTSLEDLNKDILKLKNIDVENIRSIKKAFGSKLKQALQEVLGLEK